MSLHPLSRLPDPWRRIVDWVVTLAVAIGFVLAFEAEVAKPFRIPSASMEHTLHCARPAPGCRASTSDRVLVNRLAYVFGSPQRGQIVVFKAPDRTNGCAAEDAGTTFVKRLIGLPGETVREDDHGFIWIRGPGRPRGRSSRSRTSPRPCGSPTRPTSGTPGRCRKASTSWSATTGPTRATRAPGERFPRSNLIGPVIFTYWPPGRISYHQGGW